MIGPPWEPSRSRVPCPALVPVDGVNNRQGRPRPGAYAFARIAAAGRHRHRYEVVMLRWFHAIMPKEERFFDLFMRHSQAVVAGAEALRAMLEGGDQVPQRCAAVMARENEADDITRDVLMTLRRSFITPFDRGAIKDLITSMDNAIDQMQKTAKGIVLFDVRTFTAHQKEMGDAIVAAAVLVRDTLPLLQSLNSHAARIASVTQCGDFVAVGDEDGWIILLPPGKAIRPWALDLLKLNDGEELRPALHSQCPALPGRLTAATLG